MDILRAHVIFSKGPYSLLTNIVYYLIPHYEFYDLRVRLAHSWEALPLWVACAIVLYTVLYISVILYISRLKLARKIF